MAFIRVLFAASLMSLAHSFSTFRDNIPNGKNIPSPCNPAITWNGVGHQAQGGGGARNQFGVDFKSYGYTWTSELCMMDSDGDGVSNGMELGDPDCVWEKNNTPMNSEGLSHPGICEPISSDHCKQINDFLKCASNEFKCDLLENDPGVVSVEVRLDLTPVPDKETTYMCQVLDLPSDNDYHLVAFEPYIDNINVMHHVLMYGCADDAEIKPDDSYPSECFMSRIEGCEEMLAVWALGSPGVCYHENVGFRIGTNGYKRVLMEIHWNNREPTDGYTDSSGLTLHLTTNLRSNDAGMFVIGQTQLQIPPGLSYYTANSTCSSECTETRMLGDINIIGAFNHMHDLGRSAVSQMVTEDGEVHYLSYEEQYSYDSPKFVVFDEPVVMEPGYKLEMYCHFNSQSRTEHTNYGEGASEEMCFAFIMYYPKSNWTGDDCTSYGPYDDCGVATGLSEDDCDYAALYDQEHPDTVARNYRLYEFCEPGHCKDGCLDVVRDIFQEPCFKGEDLKNIKGGLTNDEFDTGTKLGIYDFFYRLDSCNAELAWEKCGPTTGGAGSSTMASVVLVTAVAMFATLF